MALQTHEQTQGAAILATLPTAGIARCCKVTDRTARKWKSGEALPSEAARAALAREFGLSSALWFLRAPGVAEAVQKPPPAVIQAWYATVEKIHAILGSDLELTSDARSTLLDLGNAVGARILKFEGPANFVPRHGQRYAPPEMASK